MAPLWKKVDYILKPLRTMAFRMPVRTSSLPPPRTETRRTLAPETCRCSLLEGIRTSDSDWHDRIVLSSLREATIWVGCRYRDDKNDRELWDTENNRCATRRPNHVKGKMGSCGTTFFLNWGVQPRKLYIRLVSSCTCLTHLQGSWKTLDSVTVKTETLLVTTGSHFGWCFLSQNHGCI